MPAAQLILKRQTQEERLAPLAKVGRARQLTLGAYDFEGTAFLEAFRSSTCQVRRLVLERGDGLRDVTLYGRLIEALGEKLEELTIHRFSISDSYSTLFKALETTVNLTKLTMDDVRGLTTSDYRTLGKVMAGGLSKLRHFGIGEVDYRNSLGFRALVNGLCGKTSITYVRWAARDIHSYWIPDLANMVRSMPNLHVLNFAAYDGENVWIGLHSWSLSDVKPLVNIWKLLPDLRVELSEDIPAEIRERFTR